jgi:hypothetical protein
MALTVPPLLLELSDRASTALLATSGIALLLLLLLLASLKRFREATPAIPDIPMLLRSMELPRLVRPLLLLLETANTVPTLISGLHPTTCPQLPAKILESALFPTLKPPTLPLLVPLLETALIAMTLLSGIAILPSVELSVFSRLEVLAPPTTPILSLLDLETLLPPLELP